MKSVWKKWGCRNADVLDRSANAHTLVNGIKFGKLRWTGPQLLVKYGYPLVCFFTHEHRRKDTNVLDLYDSNPEFLKIALQQAVDTIDKDITLIPGNTREEALKLYEQFKNDFAIMCMAYDLFPFLTDKLKKEIGSEEYEKSAQYINQPHREPLLSQEHREIEEASTLYNSGKLNDLEVKQKADNFAKRFGFVHSEYRGKPWTAEQYEKEIIKNTNHRHEQKQTSRSLTPLEFMIQMCAYLLDQGKNAVVRTKWALRETVKNAGYNERQIMGLTETEFKKWVQNESLPDMDLEKREQYYVFVGKDKVSEYFGKDEVDKALEQEGITEFQEKTFDDIAELKGTVAFPGRVKGIARIVFTQAQAEKLEEGDILISSMTAPELMVGMRKAKAFVTDEGGMLTHAAIIAREMKKPCVTGTKNATKIFKDGDLVEVDADNGIVRKLS